MSPDQTSYDLREQSDLGPYCLQYTVSFLRTSTDEIADNKSSDWWENSNPYFIPKFK